MGNDLLFSVSPEPLKPTFSVSEYIELLNVFFKKHEHRVIGEIAELKRAASGHVYFSLKDKNGVGVLDCIIWSRTYQMCGVALEVGMEVILTGRANVYPQSGRLSFVADAVELVGEGTLKKHYEALKKKLEAEGLFDAGRKRPMPKFPRNIGIVTSLKGAVIHDFENNLGKFGFRLKVVDARVEGQIAVKDLLAGVGTMRKQNIDVLVMIRGGGSLESLQAYNNEALVRATADFPFPVIAGIGHDQDVPLVALVADFMASTPTATAHLVSRPWEDAYAEVRRVGQITVRVAQEIRRMREELHAARRIVLDNVTRGVSRAKEQIDYAERFIRIHNPERQLAMGYAIVRSGERIVRTVNNVGVGENVSVQVNDGMLESSITAKHTKDHASEI